MYALIRKFLFSLNPELSHTIALQSLRWVSQLGLARFYPSVAAKPRTVMGLTFPNPVGLAAGLDKSAEYVDALSTLGFGFIEIGTVTPKPQEGNPKPRLFRLTEEEAIINRMGFNNKGVDFVAQQLEKTAYRGILGINIGKNRDTTYECAIDDYVYGFKALWRYASYMTINVSSPNTPGLRDIEKSETLSDLLAQLKKEQTLVMEEHKKYVPIAVKISPDLSSDELKGIAEVLLKHKADGVIATNTTTSRVGVENSPYAEEKGGLSGKPLLKQSTQVLRELKALLNGQIPIIAVGGITDEASAREKFEAGADLVQIYTGFIYQGPGLIGKVVETAK